MGQLREVRAAGHEGLLLATELLQRVRRADPLAGLWEAADRQWWWRRPRLSDAVEQIFWADSQGPVAGVLLNSWTDDSWQCDPLVVPTASAPGLDVVWARARDQIGEHVRNHVEVPVRDDDLPLRELVEAAGLIPGERSSSAWLAAADRPAVPLLPEGFTLTDRTQRHGTPHPMRHRSGDTVAERLTQVPLYDPELDLAVETPEGQVVGYSLFWFDPVTEVGLIEPVRVEDDFHRRGIAKAMLAAGLERLVAKGAQRLKIGYGTEAAGALYEGLGFRTTSHDTTYELTLPPR